MQNVKQAPSQCESCGGQIKQIDINTYKCTHCNNTYYVSTTTLRKVGIHIPIQKMILSLALATIAFIAIALFIYYIYTTVLVADASRFSVAFRDFLLEVYDKPVASLDDEDLDKIKYLRIERIKKCYHFTYSFDDYYDYEPEEFENHTETVLIDKSISNFSPSNIQYLTGLTRLELYTNSWHNYALPEQNHIRSIICRSDTSRYGNSTFFERTNPETLEEVTIYSEGNLDEDRYLLDDIRTTQHLTIQRLVYDDPDMFQNFNNLKELYLLYPVMEEENAYKVIETTLQCPELEHFVIEGRAIWYLSDDEWETLQMTYGNKIKIERKIEEQ